MNRYDDIINIPYKKSTKRPHMSNYDRAAQFAPFAALVGYNDEIIEAGRLTDKRPELSEDDKKIINNKLSIINSCIFECPVICIEYFEADKLKSGGAYKRIVSSIKRIDTITNEIILVDKTRIPIQDIINITGEIFKDYDTINYL